MKHLDLLKEQSQITAAVAFIREAHSGVLYGDMPYFLHPVQVAEEAGVVINEFGASLNVTDVVIAALLHDVIEDTHYTEGDLRQQFGNTVVDMVVLLSKDSNLDYKSNIERIINSNNVGAMIVKLADNRVNFRGDKSKMPAIRAQKLTDRYSMSMTMLLTALNKII